jgi:hypothetical protein
MRQVLLPVRAPGAQRSAPGGRISLLSAYGGDLACARARLRAVLAAITSFESPTSNVTEPEVPAEFSDRDNLKEEAAAKRVTPGPIVSSDRVVLFFWIPVP